MGLPMSMDGSAPDASSEKARVLLEYLRIGAPIFLLAVFVIAFVANSIVSAKRLTKNGNATGKGPGGRPLPKRSRSTMAVTKEPQIFTPATRLLFKWLSVGVLVTFVADAAVNMAHALFYRSEHWWCGQSLVVSVEQGNRLQRAVANRLTKIYVVGSFFVYAVILVSLLDTKPSPTFAQFVPWLAAIPVELIILGLSLFIYVHPHHEPVVGDPRGGPLRRGITPWESVEVVSNIVRILILVALVLIYIVNSVGAKPRGRKAAQRPSDGPTETTGLLNAAAAENGATNTEDYGSTTQNSSQNMPKPPDPWVRPTTIPSTSWWEYLSGYSLFFPYLWPSKSRKLQLVVVVCFLLILLQRVVNVLVPYQVGVITNILSREEGGEFRIPWLEICLYILYRWLQGNQGLIGSLRSSLWIPVGQYSYMELSTAAFEHVHGLSLDFHLSKKTGEVLSALSKGNSINTFLEQVTFQVVPMLIDLCVAIGYFLVVFDAYYALVVTIVTFCYLYVTVRMAQWRAGIRRQMVNASRQEDAVK